MATQTTLFSPRTAMAGVYHSSNRATASLNTDEDGVRHRVAFATRMGMRWVGGELRIRFKATGTTAHRAT